MESRLLATSRKYIDSKLRLKVQTWMKRDNYNSRTNLDEQYFIRGRHHSRKSCGACKRYNKSTLHDMQRDMKSKSAVVLPYKCSANRWKKFVEEGSYHPCYDSCGKSESLAAPHSAEYVWESDKNCLYDQRGRCICRPKRLGFDLEGDSAVKDWPESACQSCEQQELQYHFASSTNSTGEVKNYATSVASPELSIFGWVPCEVLDTESEFDIISDLGDIGSPSDDEWEDLISIQVS